MQVSRLNSAGKRILAAIAIFLADKTYCVAKFRVSFGNFFGLLKEYLDSLPRDLLNIGLLLHRVYQTIRKVQFTYIMLVLRLSAFLGKLKLQLLKSLSHLKRLILQSLLRF